MDLNPYSLVKLIDGAPLWSVTMFLHHYVRRQRQSCAFDNAFTQATATAKQAAELVRKLRAYGVARIVMLVTVVGLIGFQLEEASAERPTVTSPVRTVAATTPAATPEPVPIAARATNAPAPVSALGISFGDVVMKFEEADMAMDYESSPLWDGTPRIMGTANTSILELTGPKHDLSKVSVSVIVSNENVAAGLDGVLRMLVVLRTAAPEMRDSVEWTNRSLSHLVENPDGEPCVKLADRDVCMTRNAELGMVHLTVEGHTPSLTAD